MERMPRRSPSSRPHETECRATASAWAGTRTSLLLRCWLCSVPRAGSASTTIRCSRARRAGEIETFALLLLGDAQARGWRRYFQDDPRRRRRTTLPWPRRQASARRPGCPSSCLRRSPMPPRLASTNTPVRMRADHSAHAVHGRDVQRVIDAQRALQNLRRYKTDDTRATPMTTAPTGPTNPDAGVMVPSPATMPVTMPSTLGLP